MALCQIIHLSPLFLKIMYNAKNKLYPKNSVIPISWPFGRPNDIMEVAIQSGEGINIETTNY